jgi:sugar phosphate permease
MIPPISGPGAEPIKDIGQIARLYRNWRRRVMYSMIVGYGLFYFLRNNLPMAAKAIIDEHHFSNTQWGGMLSIATIVYSFSKFFSGVIGDRANPRLLLSLGLLLSAIVNIAFGFAAGLTSFTVLWALNNAFQGMARPGVHVIHGRSDRRTVRAIFRSKGPGLHNDAPFWSPWVPRLRSAAARRRCSS